MCGLVGIYSRRGRPVDSYVLEVATELLHRRGPDGVGVWVQGSVGLGHRRLAVIDLSEAGAQPMLSASDSCVIAYNGEVYNFAELRDELSGPGVSWRGHSDTEVILCAYERWGVRFVRRLQGMFAIAIWDRRRRTLVLARDRIGVKPLFYSLSPDRIIFASRPRSLLVLDPHLRAAYSRSALKSYVECGYVPAPHCIYEGIEKLLPGHVLEVTDDTHRLQCYWSPNDVLPDSALENVPENELLNQLDELTDECVRARLVSDVPLGAFLSGGLDSGVVVAKMVKASSSQVHAFTIGFAESEHDESRAAAQVASHLGVRHVVEVLGADDLLALMDRYLEEFDEPFSDSSAFPTMAVSRLARRSVTVALSGDGGDELFLGYHYYNLLRQLRPAFDLPIRARKVLGAAAGMLGGHRGKLLQGALDRQSLSSAFTFMRSIRKDFGDIFDWAEWTDAMGYEDAAEARLAQIPSRLDAVSACGRLDLETTLPDDYLQKVDVSSMAFSLEAREPLLDYRLVEWALRLPVSWKLRSGQGKYLWRRLAGRYLPEQIVNGRKRGFTVPIDRWLRGPLARWCEERISDPLLFETIPLRRNAVESLMHAHKIGERNAYPILWALALLADFLRREQAA